MNPRNTDIEIEVLRRQVRFHKFVVLILVLATLASLLLVHRMYGNERIHIHPPGAGKYWISGRSLDRQYLESMTDYAAQLQLTGDATSVQVRCRRLVEELADPDPEVRKRLQDDCNDRERAMKRDSSAGAWYPRSVAADASKMAVAVSGILHTWVGDRRVAQKQRTFVYYWRLDRSGRLYLVETREVEANAPFRQD